MTTEKLASVLRQAGGKQALLLEDSRLRCCPRGEIFGIHQTGDGCWLQLHGAPPHRGEGITSLLGCESTREPAVAAVHARLSARNNVGLRGGTFIIKVPVAVGKGVRVTT